MKKIGWRWSFLSPPVPWVRVAAATLAITGCDSRDLTAPALRGPQPRAADISAPLALGSATVTPPGTSGSRDVLSPPRITIASVPESAWVVITASGQLSIRRNPDCDLIVGFWTCPAKIITPDFEAAPSPVGPLHLLVESGSSIATVNLRGSGGAGESPGSAIGLLHQSTAGTLQGEMSIWPAETFNPNGDGGTPSWFLGGGYNVTATAVPSPVEFTESDPDSTGTRTYTLTPLYGLVFMNPTGDSRPAGTINWYFIPGDSVSSTPGWSEYNEWIQECQYQTTCRFLPPGPGRVQVNASVERQGVTVRSGDAPPPQCHAGVGPLGSAAVRLSVSGSGCDQQPKLVLSCDPSPLVRRGSSVACSAAATPAGAMLTDLVWTFVDSAGHQIPGPTGTTMTWGGEIVVSGKMVVTGKVNGVQVADSSLLRVEPRSWPTPRLDVQEKGHGDLPAPSAVTVVGDLAHTHVDDPSGLAFHTIQDGPNKGWAVLDSMPSVPITIHINDAWKPGSAWYELQHYGNYVDPVTGAHVHYCAKYELPGLLPDVRGHEGSIPWSLTSHVDVFRDWVRNHRPQDQMEAVVTYEPDLAGTMTLADWLLSEFQNYVRTPMMSDPDQNHTIASPPGRVDVPVFPCLFRY